MKAWLTIVFWSRLPVKYWTEKSNETTVRTCAFWGSFGSISELPFVRKHFRASVRSNIFSSFRAFKSISELPLVRKYYRTSVRSKVLPSFRSCGCITERPFDRKHWRATQQRNNKETESTQGRMTSIKLRVLVYHFCVRGAQLPNLASNLSWNYLFISSLLRANSV